VRSVKLRIAALLFVFAHRLLDEQNLMKEISPA
jgi:hypothetical protein